ncbi:MAG TPA: hypothetical protein VGL48_07955 [Acidimicrobiales bacterium]|jgi:hypothetical protein
MAICPQCQGEMMEGISCLSDPISIGGRRYEPVRWGEEKDTRHWDVTPFCRDCNVPLGGVHHPGCCIERCPACGGQAWGCYCFEDEVDEVAPAPPSRCRTHLFRQQRR